MMIEVLLIFLGYLYGTSLENWQSSHQIQKPIYV